MKQIDEITGEIIDAAVKLHIRFGPGLLESVYEATLVDELRHRGLPVVRQHSVDIEVDGRLHENAFRVDLLVGNAVVVEIKSIEKLAPVHSKQLLTYLRLMNLSAGLLINFGGATLKEGLHRVVNSYVSSVPPRLRVNGREPDGAAEAEGHRQGDR